ncbi:MAG: polymer-forming cytoskeletal protein [Lachnospiraceae bacterium]
MSFFKDFKDDLSQAVNDITDEEKELDSMEKSDLLVNTLDEEEKVDVKTELAKLDGLLEQVSTKKDKKENPENAASQRQEEKKNEGPTAEEIMQYMKSRETKHEEETAMSAEDKKGAEVQEEVKTVVTGEISDETTIITAGTTLKGNMESTGSIDVRGMIDGNITCNGKLVVTGEIKGNSTSSEFFADAAKIEGEISSSGTVKIGLGSVVIGNISATSAVIAGAIKGDIDIQGPVVVDTSAVVMGNIKSRSVQINNGAVIEGFCSQSYAEIDVESLFQEQE